MTKTRTVGALVLAIFVVGFLVDEVDSFIPSTGTEYWLHDSLRKVAKQVVPRGGDDMGEGRRMGSRSNNASRNSLPTINE